MDNAMTVYLFIAVGWPGLAMNICLRTGQARFGHP